MRTQCLTTAEVNEVHRLINEPCKCCGMLMPQLVVAKRFHITPSTASRIGTGQITEGYEAGPTSVERNPYMDFSENGKRMNIGEKVDEGAPVVLQYSDHAVVRDGDGYDHNMFQMDRRILVLSVPKSIDLNAATTVARDLLEEVAGAMEAGK